MHLSIIGVEDLALPTSKERIEALDICHSIGVRALDVFLALIRWGRSIFHAVTGVVTSQLQLGGAAR